MTTRITDTQPRIEITADAILAAQERTGVQLVTKSWVVLTNNRTMIGQVCPLTCLAMAHGLPKRDLIAWWEYPYASNLPVDYLVEHSDYTEHLLTGFWRAIDGAELVPKTVWVDYLRRGAASYRDYSRGWHAGRAVLGELLARDAITVEGE